MKIKTLDGELTDYSEIKYRNLLENPQKLMEVMNKVVRKNPALFAEACAVELGIGYVPPRNKNRVNKIRSLLNCCIALEDSFGYFTENMIEALVTYPIEV